MLAVLINSGAAVAAAEAGHYEQPDEMQPAGMVAAGAGYRI